MFIGREKELKELKAQFSSGRKSAVLVYGRRRIGKSTLIQEASRQFNGIVINYLCAQTTVQSDLYLLGKSICSALSLSEISFSSFQDLFIFLGRQTSDFLIILDEYQYLKEGGKKGEVDSVMQAVIDQMPDNVKLVLCGSFVTVMRELLEENNPLFGRFTSVIHLEEMDYYTSAGFYEKKSVREKIARYAIYGGSPYVLANTSEISVEDGIKKMLLQDTGLLRIYIDNILTKEVGKVYDVRIFLVLSNGRRRYSEIENALNMHSSGLLDKQLQSLIKMELIKKVFPINKPNDKKKQFYEINDNLIRFYFTYIFGNESILSHLGPDAYYNLYILPSINEFISRRFENIAVQFFQRKIQSGKINDVYDVGTYWYDDPLKHTNGEFNCVLKRRNTYDFFECKYYQKPMTLHECEEEEKQIKRVPDLNKGNIGFICSAGFLFSSNQYQLITGNDIYKDESL